MITMVVAAVVRMTILVIIVVETACLIVFVNLLIYHFRASQHEDVLLLGVGCNGELHCHAFPWQHECLVHINMRLSSIATNITCACISSKQIMF